MGSWPSETEATSAATPSCMLDKTALRACVSNAPEKGGARPGGMGSSWAVFRQSGLTLAESIKANCNGIDHIKSCNSGINSLNEFGRETLPNSAGMNSRRLFRMREISAERYGPCKRQAAGAVCG